VSEAVFWSGNEVVAEAAIAAGCRFFGGYPITPSSEIAAVMSKRLPEVGGTFIQMEDEIAAMGAVIGASMAGAKSMTATSGPGFSLKQENIGFACMVEAPCVVVDVQRGGPSTGLPTHPGQSDFMQARWGTHGDHATIALAPAYLRELYLEMIRAFNLSEKFRVPVIVLIDEIIGHMSECFVVPTPDEYAIANRVKPNLPPDKYNPYEVNDGELVPPMANYFEGYRFHATGLNHDKTGFPTTDPIVCHLDEVRQIDKVAKNRGEIDRWEEVMVDDAEILVVAFGSTARGAHTAIEDARRVGIRAGLFRPITVWPFPDEAVRRLASRMKAVIVAEMNLGQMVLEVERAVHSDIKVVGCHKVGGVPIEPYEIVAKIREVAGEPAPSRPAPKPVPELEAQPFPANVMQSVRNFARKIFHGF
jgi:2-oxoglutarate ferredoxin oxidoreductase subunit alpha